MKVLLDTNIIFDFFLERESFFQSANQVFAAIVSEQIDAFLELQIFFTLLDDKPRALRKHGEF